MIKHAVIACVATGLVGFFAGESRAYTDGYHAGAKDQFQADTWIINSSDFHADKAIDAMLRCRSYSQMGILNMLVDPARKFAAVREIEDQCSLISLDEVKEKHYG